jgi:arylsulfatase
VDLLPTFLAMAGAPVGAGASDGISLVPALSTPGTTIDRDVFWSFRGVRALRRGRWKLLDRRLYDLEADPAERRDVAAEHPDIVRELSAAARRIADGR